MKAFARTALVAAALFTLPVVAQAAEAKPDRYIYDPVHTQIEFRADHLGFSHPTGRFLKFTGGFTFDPAAPESAEVHISIDPASLDMGSNDWQRAMTGSEFLDVAKYKEITFKSTKILRTGDKTGKMTGDLTIHGVTRPVTLDVTYNKSGTHPYNKNYLAGFSATATLKRSDYGMTFGLPGIGDVVEISLQVEGIRQDFNGIDKK
ncbi:MAG: YceI family protein [Micavibrio sp.]|nr:YceI family protein [Micavibrio sp.]